MYHIESGQGVGIEKLAVRWSSLLDSAPFHMTLEVAMPLYIQILTCRFTRISMGIPMVSLKCLPFKEIKKFGNRNANKLNKSMLNYSKLIVSQTILT